jgi:hypothetical protein
MGCHVSMLLWPCRLRCPRKCALSVAAGAFRLTARDTCVVSQDVNGNGNGAGSSADGNGSSPGDDEENQLPDLYESWHPKNPYEVRVDMPNLLSPELQ